MFDFTLPNSPAVLPIADIQIPAPWVAFPALGQATEDNAPPPSQKLTDLFPQNWLAEDFPSLGQATADNAPPPQPK